MSTSVETAADIGKTKYPIILVHGMGVRDDLEMMWGRIPKALRERGNQVYFGGHDANGSTVDNAEVLKSTILQIIEKTGCEKVNLIAHSKGGIDSRYMITHLGMEDKIASLTTCATPHHGSKTMDFFDKWPKFLLKFGSKVTDLIYKILGDKNPKTYECICSFCTHASKKFNDNTPNSDKVYYQSYAFYMKRWNSDVFLIIPHAVVSVFDGKNDGLLPPSAAEWGNFRGTYCGNSNRGISHGDEVDLRKRRFTKKDGEQISDMSEFYVGIVDGLVKMGF